MRAAQFAAAAMGGAAAILFGMLVLGPITRPYVAEAVEFIRELPGVVVGWF